MSRPTQAQRREASRERAEALLGLTGAMGRVGATEAEITAAVRWSNGVMPEAIRAAARTIARSVVYGGPGLAALARAGHARRSEGVPVTTIRDQEEACWDAHCARYRRDERVLDREAMAPEDRATVDLLHAGCDAETPAGDLRCQHCGGNATGRPLTHDADGVRHTRVSDCLAGEP